MTKVEELREKLMEALGVSWGHGGVGSPYETLDSLIAAAKEEERKRIRKESLHYAEGEPLEGSDAESVEGEEAIAQQEMFIIPASLLSPAPKEAK